MFSQSRYDALATALAAVQNRPGHVLATPAVEGTLEEAELFRTAQGPYSGLTLGQSLTLVLERLQLSYEGLADASQAVGLGLHASTISRFSRAVRGPTLYQLANLCPGLAAAAANLGGAPEGMAGHTIVSFWVTSLTLRTVDEMWDGWLDVEPSDAS